ncbi:hypothetical protein [Planomonospora sp. ID82291]|uniref:hypothetical protein n=1 Tax=Planomonospora sp. ID82291 TaxID=2738136 RepID=UPI0018C3E34A|nr:hypothetical protein [Planomonospora sp. ID82291]MBG0816727.1 hypothetical protein [Planomonospora sp. ID82291]
MSANIGKLADRLLGVFAPQVTAKADPCPCSSYGKGYRYWGAACDTGGWYYRYTCNGCQWVRTCDKRYH